MEETGNVKALEKALCVLDAVRDADSPLGVNEIAKICGMSAATVYRMLRTMRSHGWVYQDENEKYTVGYKISLATFGTSFRLAMRETAYHVMARLSESEQSAAELRERLAGFDDCAEKLRDYDRMSQKMGELMLKAASDW